MSNARALLRDHRAQSRTIQHRHAFYSNSGKLLCKLCHENIKADVLWDIHVASAGHQQRAMAVDPSAPDSSGSPAAPHQQKRKLGDVGEVDDSDNGFPLSDENRMSTDQDSALGGPQASSSAPASSSSGRNVKRSRTDTLSAIGTGVGNGNGNGNGNENGNGTGNGNGNGNANSNGEKEGKVTPTRRSSSTLAQGVEIAIPSRPATPLIHSANTGEAEIATPQRDRVAMGRSPLNSLHANGMNEGDSSFGPQAHDRASFVGAGSLSIPTTTATASITTESAAIPGSSSTTTTTTTAAAATATATATLQIDSTADVNEVEWAAFEAEIAAAEDQAQAQIPAPDPFSADAVISAPALTAAEVQAKSLEEEQTRKRLATDAEMADEREDATRALEDEFDEMEQLEVRVRRLKERREELRRGSVASLQKRNPVGLESTEGDDLGNGNGKVDISLPDVMAVATSAKADEESEIEDDEIDDDWFRH